MQLGGVPANRDPLSTSVKEISLNHLQPTLRVMLNKAAAAGQLPSDTNEF